MPAGMLAHTHLPYCLERTKDGAWLALNRNYKPVGVTAHDHVDYDTHPDRVRIKAPSLQRLQAVSAAMHRGEDGEPCRIYLYDDGSAPDGEDRAMRAYAEALAAFAVAKLE